MPNVSVNGIKMAFDEAGAGEGLILIHGLGWSRRQWALQVPVFSQHYRTIVMDYRGHGESGKPKEQHTLQDISDDLYEFMRVIELKRAHVLGFSQGGMIAQLFTLDHPEMVDKLILADAPVRSHPGFVDHYVHLIEELGPAALSARLARDNIEAKVPEEARRIVEEDFIRNPKETFIRNYRAELGFDVEDRLHEIKRPTLIIVGEKDRLIGDAQLENRLIVGSTLVVIKGSGHSTCIEKAEDFNRAVVEFLGAD